jgi:ABC-2 type transport system ATP-binding protein
MDQAITAEHISRNFRTKGTGKSRDITAVDDISLEIGRGELFGLLGPNGAGKTTLIKIFCTLLLPSLGKATVAGYDVHHSAHAIRRRINLVAGGEYSGYGILSVRENLWMFSQFYNVDFKTSKKRIDELLAIVGLEDKASTRVNQLSTGMKQKMNFARGFINDPEILFLDEPTLGLDVTTSRQLRSYVRRWLEEDRRRTVLLTTHYMAEADELCDRVAIINQGKIIACDSPAGLKKSVPYSSDFEITIRSKGNDWHDLAGISQVASFAITAGDAGDDTMTFRLMLESDRPLEKIFATIIDRGASIISVRRTDPTLEDVFIRLCGRGLDSEVE